MQVVRRSFDAIVIGGGIHGASVALHLAFHGLDVALLERDRLGGHASGVNAGSIHHIPRIHFELPLAEAALSSWARIEQLLEDDCGFRQVGYLKVIESDDEMPDAERSMARVSRYSGIPEILLDRQALADLQPGLDATAVGGIFAPTCGYASPARAMMALRRRLDGVGAVVLETSEVRRISRQHHTWICETGDKNWCAPILVNCAGAWGVSVAGLVGEHVELCPVALMMTVCGRVKPLLNTVVGLHGRRLSMKQPQNGTILIGGGYQGDVLPATRDTRLNGDRLAYNLALARKTLPALSSAAVVRMWAGIEGITPDHAPYIGSSLIHEGLWHCFGFSTHGFYLGPITGRLLAEAIVKQEVPELLRPFALDRGASAAASSRAVDGVVRENQDEQAK